jgi:hypothetical protein
MRVVGKVEAGLGVGGAPAGIDPEGTDLPIRRNGPDQEEGQDQAAEKQPQSCLATAAALLLIIRSLQALDRDRRIHDHGGANRDERFLDRRLIKSLSSVVRNRVVGGELVHRGRVVRPRSLYRQAWHIARGRLLSRRLGSRHVSRLAGRGLDRRFLDGFACGLRGGLYVLDRLGRWRR